ncbi:MAG: PAS domain S-box protein [Nitrospira sp.]|uniref:Oxygen sensor histidine kinase NreB n=1 Tax=Nitrospira defluvii TaxID=330214 RepID=A0ABM8QDW7_9BACT|nr:PAS domain S-box protein [Nitrospira defluvii]MCS6326698.1 PAS domain S-box protein [Nitrospira sp.]CAE6691870.1 Nitrogen regulation protein B [Nitrospira defluvii]
MNSDRIAFGDDGLTRVAVIFTRPDGIISSFSHAAERLLGVTAETVVGHLTPAAFHDPLELDARRRTIVAQVGTVIEDPFGVIVGLVSLGQMVEEEWTYIDGTGCRIPVRLFVSALPDKRGNIVGYCFVVKDRRGQLQAEALLQRQAKLLDLANDAILVRDLVSDTITYWNEGAVRLYGWTSGEALGAYIHEFLHTTFPCPLEEIKREFLQAGLWRGELVHRTRAGRTITVSSRWTLLRDSSGVPSGSLELNTDITEQKRTQEALTHAHEELEARVLERTAALREANERLRILSRRLMEIQESERRAIARDLHDEIGQALTAIKLNLREIRTVPGSEAVENQIVDSLEILGQVLQRVRSLALDLRPSLLDELGLGPALRWYVGRQAERAGWEALVSVEALTSRPSPEVEIACFRLTQEALTNVARHSQASKVEVRLERAHQELTLVIRDNGIGFDLEMVRAGARAGTSVGLSGMEERVQLAGGTVTITSAPAAGTEIRASFPLAAASESSREDLQ